MTYYTKQFDTLKEGVQGAMIYSPDLTEAVAVVEADMAADWDALTGDAWADVFLPAFVDYCLNTATTHYWGVEADKDTVRITKRSKAFVTFEHLSTGVQEVTLLELNLAGWTKHS